MRFLFLGLLISSFVFLGSCKKCFNCKNICRTCVLKDSADVVIASKSFCSDSANYYKGDSLRAKGYICDTIASSVSKDFCSNNAAEENYKIYYNDKQFKCTNK